MIFAFFFMYITKKKRAIDQVQKTCVSTEIDVHIFFFYEFNNRKITYRMKRASVVYKGAMTNGLNRI